MSKCSVVFEDVKDDQVGMNIDLPSLENADDYTGAVHLTLLIEFIIKRGYHTQFEEEFYNHEIKELKDQKGR
jgi:hypothetical protein